MSPRYGSPSDAFAKCTHTVGICRGPWTRGPSISFLTDCFQAVSEALRLSRGLLPFAGTPLRCRWRRLEGEAESQSVLRWFPFIVSSPAMFFQIGHGRNSCNVERMLRVSPRCPQVFGPPGDVAGLPAPSARTHLRLYVAECPQGQQGWGMLHFGSII